MIGTSGPSTSTTTLSTPRPNSAASTCSVVDTAGPWRSPSTVANSVAVTERKFAHKFAIFLASYSGPPKHHAGVGFGRMKCDGYGGAGMHAYPGNGHLLTQGRLPPGLHAPRHALIPELGPVRHIPSRPSQSEERPRSQAANDISGKAAPRPMPRYRSPRPNRNIPATPFWANTRFLTECYLGPAPIFAQSRHMI